MKGLVKKASDLHLDELHLSSVALSGIKRSGFSVDRLVFDARCYSLLKDRWPDIKTRTFKWKEEFTSALDRAGYIWHDKAGRTFYVRSLYEDVFSYGTSAPYNGPIDNEQYEDFHLLTDAEFRNVHFRLKDRLTPLEYDVVRRAYGLLNGHRFTCPKITKIYGDFTVKQIFIIKENAVRKLRQKNTLPNLFMDLGRQPR